MPDRSDTKLLQVLRRQTREDGVVDVILAECRLILFEAKLPQPTSDVHGATLVRLPLHDPPGKTACLGRGSNDRFGSFSTKSSNSANELMSASTPKATKIARRRNMSRWAVSGRECTHSITSPAVVRSASSQPCC